MTKSLRKIRTEEREALLERIRWLKTFHSIGPTEIFQNLESWTLKRIQEAIPRQISKIKNALNQKYSHR